MLTQDAKSAAVIGPDGKALVGLLLDSNTKAGDRDLDDMLDETTQDPLNDIMKYLGEGAGDAGGGAANAGGK